MGFLLLSKYNDGPFQEGNFRIQTFFYTALAVLVVVGFTCGGRREVLDWRVADSESRKLVADATGSLKVLDLKPVTGKNADVALEWYFAPTGSLTATVFKHKFENYIIRSLAMETFDGKQYRMDRPRNVNEGQLEGIEIGYRQFYDFLPGWLGGFGLEANYTYMKGHLVDGGKEVPFQGMSKNAANIVGLYERGPWSGRLAYNYRSKFVDAFNYRAIPAPVGPITTVSMSCAASFASRGSGSSTMPTLGSIVQKG